MAKKRKGRKKKGNKGTDPKSIADKITKAYSS